MSRMVSLVILVVVVLLMAGLFLVVMAQFLLPMFLALLLVVLFRPLHQWLLVKCRQRKHLAAGLTTLAILVIVLVPLLLLVYRAAIEGAALASSVDREQLRQDILQRGGGLIDDARGLARKFGVEVPPNKELVHSAVTGFEGWVAPAAARTTRLVGSILLGLAIMLVSLYFFLADGPTMVEAALRLSPVDHRHVRQLIDEFMRMSRAVVLATLLAAVAQGVTAGIGYAAAGVSAVFLLTILTMVLALIPFVGATTIWLSCSVWLYIDGRPTAAALLFLWGMLAVSLIDNVVKPYVLHGQANLHPLLALLSVLGGIKSLGPIGIFVGPMVVAFLQSLLTILRTELDAMDSKPPTAPASPVPLDIQTPRSSRAD